MTNFNRTPGDTSGVAIPAGYVGQVVESTFSFNATGGLAGENSYTISSLPIGNWLIMAYGYQSGGRTNFEVAMSISTTSATHGDTSYCGSNASGSRASVSTQKSLSITTPTNVYVVCSASLSFTFSGKITAIRIA
jgi:hypothetical protein